MKKSKDYMSIGERKLFAEMIIYHINKRHPELNYNKFIKILGFSRHYLGKEEGIAMFNRIKGMS
jgi:hypothetical protein